METRRTLFKINEKLIMSRPSELKLDEIMIMKAIIADECKCDIDDICVEYDELPPPVLSEIDVSIDGMFDWRDVHFEYISGVSLSIKEGSDEYLDAFAKGRLEDYLIFI